MRLLFTFLLLSIALTNLSYASNDVYDEKIIRLENMDDFSESENLKKIKSLYEELKHINSKEEEKRIHFEIDYSWIKYYQEKNKN